MYTDNTYVKIDLDAIAENFDAVCHKAGTDVMAVVKADAYGHGAVQIAHLLEDKCAFFGVSSMQEAQELRHSKAHFDSGSYTGGRFSHRGKGKCPARHLPL